MNQLATDKDTVLTVWSSWGRGTRSEAGSDHWSSPCSWVFQSQDKRLIFFWQGNIILSVFSLNSWYQVLGIQFKIVCGQCTYFAAYANKWQACCLLFSYSMPLSTCGNYTCFRSLVAWSGVYLYAAMMSMLIYCFKRTQALDRKCLYWHYVQIHVYPLLQPLLWK